MSEVMERADAFLRRYGMEPERVDIDACTQRFLEEMGKGLRGDPTPVLMLPTYLTLQETLPRDKTVIAVDAGGTNFRVALVTLTEGEPRVEELSVHPMPGSLGAVTRAQFIDQVSQLILPLTRRSREVGFCFSYAAEILPNGDGRVLDMSKQVQVEDCKGLELGAELSAALAAKGAEGVRFVVLNDTVAAVLGGVAGLQGHHFDGYVGLIYGTGVNTCYAERTGRIVKLSTPWRPETMILNMESGGFCGVPQGEFDRRLDRAAVDPGKCQYEKMVSGRYQGGVICHALRQAAADGLFSEKAAPGMAALGELPLAEIDAFCARPYGDNPLSRLCAAEEDRETVYTLVDRSVERAARLVCANLSAVLLQGGMGGKIHRPACVVAEGSTFYKGQLFRGKLERICHEHITGRLDRHLVFRKVENANLVGTAAAALTGL